MKFFNIFKRKTKTQAHKQEQKANDFSDISKNTVLPLLTSENNVDIQNTLTQADDEDNYIDELNRLAREESDRLYMERETHIHSFNPNHIDLTNLDTSPLTSTEMYFLQKIATQKVYYPDVAGYWEYDYGIEYSKIMTKLLGNNYLKISSKLEDLSFLTIPKLKKILSSASLPVSGRKAELIERIKQKISINDLEKYYENSEQRYFLTSKGIEIISNLPKSATKNLEMEDACIACLIQKDFNQAYRLICQFERSKRFPRGLGVDWSREFHQGLINSSYKLYEDFFVKDIPSLPPSAKAYETQIKAGIILGHMLGVSYRDTKNLINRLTGLKELDYSLIEKQFISMWDDAQEEFIFID